MLVRAVTRSSERGVEISQCAALRAGRARSRDGRGTARQRRSLPRALPIVIAMRANELLRAVYSLRRSSSFCSAWTISRTARRSCRRSCRRGRRRVLERAFDERAERGDARLLGSGLSAVSFSGTTRAKMFSRVSSCAVRCSSCLCNDERRIDGVQLTHDVMRVSDPFRHRAAAAKRSCRTESL